MIIFNLSGGLGNQFFQYAFGRYLAQKNQTDLLLYQKSFETNPDRRPILDYFRTQYRIANDEDFAFYEAQYTRLHPFLKKYYRKPGFVKLKRYFDDTKMPGFHSHLKEAKKGYFNGYWGNENYFKEIRELLLKEFTLKQEYISPEYNELESEVRAINSVMVHIRRGDYVSNPIFGQLFNVLDKEYYIKAIDHISKNVADPVFYFFSDDTDWVKEELISELNCQYNFINDQLEHIDYLEFSLMKSCKHFIIANSTFSWWAAWLGQDHEKVVIAPHSWYKDKVRQRSYEQDSFLPKDWMKI